MVSSYAVKSWCLLRHVIGGLFHGLTYGFQVVGLLSARLGDHDQSHHSFENWHQKSWIFRSAQISRTSGKPSSSSAPDFRTSTGSRAIGTAVFPHEFYQSLLEAAGSASRCRAEYGGSGLGITEAAVMMQAIAESGAGMSGASSVHIPVFSVQPVVLFGTPEQKQRILPAVVSGKDRVCFAVTEPNAGLNTTEITTRAERRDGGYLVNGEKIWISTAQVANKMLLLARTTPLEQVKRKTHGLSLFYTDLDRSKIEVRLIHKMGRHAVDSNMLFIQDLWVPKRTASAPRARASRFCCMV